MSTKTIYRESLSAKGRKLLMDMCVDLERQGKIFLYIVPSREAIKYVRHSLYRRGIEGSKVMMFDELERYIAYGSVADDKSSVPAVDKIVLDTVCRAIREELLYFEAIADKEGFTDDMYRFIRTCKRQYIASEDLLSIIDQIEDSILQAKLKDIYNIYSAYEEELQRRNIYSMDDIGTTALCNTLESPYLDNVDTIIIDGFTDIDPIDMNIIKKIAAREDVNLYVNIPCLNPLMCRFVDRVLVEPLASMGFSIEDDEHSIEYFNTPIARLVSTLYTGRQVCVDTNSISIKRYPCVRSEIRETAKDIEQRLEEGESAYNMAVYMDDREEYSREILSVFKEFDIPIELNYSLPISSSALARELIAVVRETDVQYMHWAQWLNLMEDYLLHREEICCQDEEELDSYGILNAEAWKNIDKQLRLLRSSIDSGHISNSLIGKEDFLKYFKKWISTSTVQIEYGEKSGVRILGTDLAIGQRYRHIYILGMNDGIIPNLPSDIDMLTRQERNILMGMGLNYKNRDWELKREKIRLCLALATGTCRVVLSYRETGRGDEMLIPSPFIEEIKLISSLEEEAFDMKDRFVIEDPIEESLLYRHRQEGKYFNNYEGIVSPSLLPIDEDFYIGATDIDEFYFCPYSFFMGKIMGGRIFEQSHTEYDNIDIGNFYHVMLREYYMYLDQFESLDEERLNSIYKKVLEAEIRDLDLPDVELGQVKREFFDPLYEVIGVFISKDLKRLKKYKSDTGRELRPIMLERSFRDSNIFGIDMRCRVDRVDMEYANIDGDLVPTGKFVVYDYKKSRSRGLDHILNHNVCQLGIYYFLIRDELEKMGYGSLDCMALLYYGIEENGEDNGKAIKYDGIYRAEYKKELGLGRKHYAMDEQVFDAFLGYIKELTLYAIDQIREGKFHYAPNCPVYTEQFVRYNCEYKKICRYNRHKIRTILEEGGEICYGKPFRGV